MYMPLLIPFDISVLIMYFTLSKIKRKIDSNYRQIVIVNKIQKNYLGSGKK